MKISVTAFESDKVRALLAYLAVESDRPHRRERLAGLLWPERTERSARRNLNQALFNLRQAIGDHDAEPPFLLITPQALQFSRSSDHWLDVATFEGLLAACEAHPHRRLEACALCADRLRQGTALYRGPFLEGFSLDDSSAFEEWVLLERERLQRMTLDALRCLASRHERHGEYERTLGYAWRQVAIDAWREQAHREAMRCLVLSGRRNEALAQYETCRRGLEEAGVKPEEETTMLYERIRDGERLPSLSILPPHNLPASLTSFVGRAAALAAIQDHLEDPDCRLLTLVGPGGIGKTRLALEASRAQVGDFDHGVFFVSLAAVQSIESIVPTVAEALGFSFFERSNPDQRLLDYLHEKEMLLVLDSLEHLLAPPQSFPREGTEGCERLVTDILKAAPDITILVTSRVRLRVQGEHLFAVVGMDVPESLPADKRQVTEMARYDAVELFLSCARRAQQDLGLTDDGTDVACICQLVEGIPLGIMLAAAWVGVLSPAEIAAQIGQGLDILEADLRDVPERQRSIRAAFDHSWRLLAVRERQVFRALSVFRGGFTRRAAHAIAGVELHELRRLVDSVLLYRASTGRYEVHELLRQYAAEKLRAAGETDAAGDAHTIYYVAALERWDADIKGLRQQEALAEMEAEIENARAAWNRAVEREQVAQLGRAVDGLCRFYEWRERHREGEAACRMATGRLAPADGRVEAASAERQHLSAKVLAWQGFFEYLAGHTKLAGQLLQRSLALLEALQRDGQDTQSTRAHVLLQMGEATVDSDRERAKPLYEQSLALYRAVGDRWGTANVLALLGLVGRRLGSYGSETEQLLKESWVLRRELGDRRGMAQSLELLANLAAYRGPLDQSVRMYREAIAIAREIGDEGSISSARGDLVAVHLGLGEFSEARSVAEEYLALCKDLGSKGNLAYALCMLSFAEVHCGKYEQAHTYAKECIGLAQATGFQWAIGFSLFQLGCVALVAQEYVQAQQSLRESIGTFRALKQRDERAWALSVLSMAALRLYRPLLAESCLYESLHIASQVGGIFSLMHILPAVALYAVDRGNVEQAVELCAVASRFPYVTGSRWFESVFGDDIVAAAALLPPDIVVAAQERGRSRDPWTTVEELLTELEK